jgi:hypothetical protein
LESGLQAGDWFRWARVSIQDAPRIAAASGFRVAGLWRGGGRQFVRLVRQGPAR